MSKSIYVWGMDFSGCLIFENVNSEWFYLFDATRILSLTEWHSSWISDRDTIDMIRHNSAQRKKINVPVCRGHIDSRPIRPLFWGDDFSGQSTDIFKESRKNKLRYSMENRSNVVDVNLAEAAQSHGKAQKTQSPPFSESSASWMALAFVPF